MAAWHRTTPPGPMSEAQGTRRCFHPRRRRCGANASTLTSVLPRLGGLPRCPPRINRTRDTPDMAPLRPPGLNRLSEEEAEFRLRRSVSGIGSSSSGISCLRTAEAERCRGRATAEAAAAGDGRTPCPARPRARDLRTLRPHGGPLLDHPGRTVSNSDSLCRSNKSTSSSSRSSSRSTSHTTTTTTTPMSTTTTELSRRRESLAEIQVGLFSRLAVFFQASLTERSAPVLLLNY